MKTIKKEKDESKKKVKPGVKAIKVESAKENKVKTVKSLCQACYCCFKDRKDCQPKRKPAAKKPEVIIPAVVQETSRQPKGSNLLRTAFAGCSGKTPVSIAAEPVAPVIPKAAEVIKEAVKEEIKINRNPQ